MRDFAVLDCETDPFEYGVEIKPFVFGVYSPEFGFLVFNTADETLAFLREKRIVVYAHNGGRFDYYWFKNEINAGEDIKFINGRAAKFKIGVGEFRDSFSIIPISLKSAYKKEDFDYSLMKRSKRDKPANRRLILEYLKSDCLYLYELVKGFRNINGDRLTIAGASMAQWESISGLKKPKTNQYYFDLFKPYYFGGRVEVFKPGVFENVQIHSYDINSAYPYAMLSEHPYDPVFQNARNWPIESEYPNSFFTIKCPSIGAFPFQFKDQEALAFPNDGETREFNITGWELIAALDNGLEFNKVELIERFTFTQRQSFRQYIDKFYALRKEAKEGSPEKTTYKLLMNSLYGRFGLDPRNYKRFQICDLAGLEAKQNERFKSGQKAGWQFGGRYGLRALVTAPPINGNEFCNVATAASITGFVRAYLYRFLKRASVPYYCDTDSIKCHFLPCEISNELGAWKNEFTATRAAFAGKKMYALVNEKTGESMTAHKGFKATAEEIFDLARGGELEYKKESPSISLISGMKFIKRNIVATAI